MRSLSPVICLAYIKIKTLWLMTAKLQREALKAIPIFKVTDLQNLTFYAKKWEKMLNDFSFFESKMVDKIKSGNFYVSVNVHFAFTF